MVWGCDGPGCRTQTGNNGGMMGNNNQPYRTGWNGANQALDNMWNNRMDNDKKDNGASVPEPPSPDEMGGKAGSTMESNNNNMQMNSGQMPTGGQTQGSTWNNQMDFGSDRKQDGSEPEPTTNSKSWGFKNQESEASGPEPASNAFGLNAANDAAGKFKEMQPEFVPEFQSAYDGNKNKNGNNPGEYQYHHYQVWSAKQPGSSSANTRSLESNDWNDQSETKEDTSECKSNEDCASGCCLMASPTHGECVTRALPGQICGLAGFVGTSLETTHNEKKPEAAEDAEKTASALLSDIDEADLPYVIVSPTRQQKYHQDRKFAQKMNKDMETSKRCGRSCGRRKREDDPDADEKEQIENGVDMDSGGRVKR